MQQNNIERQDWEPEVKGQGLDIQQIVGKLRYLWPWMLVCVLVAVTIAGLYLYFTPNQYRVNAKILIKDDEKKGGGGGADLSMLKSIGLLSGGSNVDNELEIIRSYTLMREVVQDLQLNVRYYKKEGFKSVELYGEEVPFKIWFQNYYKGEITDQASTYKVVLDEKGVSLVSEDANKYFMKWNDTLTLPEGRIVAIGDLSKLEDKDTQFEVKFCHPDVKADELIEKLETSIPNKQVTTIKLGIEETVPKRGEEMLNKLIDVYMKANVDDNNRIADSSMAFIDARLMVVGDQLSDIEKQIQVFKQKNEISDLGEQAKALINSTSDYAREVSRQEVQLNVIESLERYIKENSNNPRIVPASLVVQDPTLAAVVGQYNSLLMQRARMLLGSTESNPMIVNIDGQLQDLRQDMLSGIQSVKRGAQAALKSLRSNTSELEARMRQVPQKERVALDYGRQQAIQQELYLFLLQKREETAISRSSTIANARIIDAAKTAEKPVKPKKKVIMAIALLVGLILPFGVSYGRSMINTRLRTRADIDAVAEVPVIAEIGHSQDEEIVVANAGSRSVIAEQFRGLRTNLQYILTEPEQKTILVTSSMSGEGKTFVSINLASVLALAGKKVALLELDLRKPKITSSLGLTMDKGFSTYAIGKASLDEVLIPSGIHENCYLLPSGPIPPNPAELLMNERTDVLFQELEQRFDFIIIDSTPNVVADALLLAKKAHAALFIVRANKTEKEQMRIPNSLFREQKLPRMNLVVNDINQSKYGGGYYGYGGYAQYGGYAEEIKKKWWKR
jgi:tyrosine-protein kinase Etk/Wzc